MTPPDLAIVEDLSLVPGAMAQALVVDGEILEREIPGVGLLRFEDLGAGEWLTQTGEPARKGRRRYLLDGADLLSVSQIIGTLGKQEALVPWAERVSIEATVRAIQDGVLDPACAAEDAVRLLRDEQLDAAGVRDRAAQRGKAIHTVFYRYVLTGEAPKLADFPQDWHPWVQGAAKALLALDAEPEIAELPVCNPRRGYAGRPDLIARCRWRGRRARLLLDYKTGKGRVYDSAHYQTRLYEGCLEPCQIAAVEDIVIVGVDDTGEFELVRCEITEPDALNLLSVHQSRKRANAGMAAQRKADRAVRG